MEDSRTLNAPDYVDGQDGRFTIDGLMEGQQYLFSAQARNQFGSSAFSGNSDLIEAGTGMLCVQCVYRYLSQYLSLFVRVHACTCVHVRA